MAQSWLQHVNVKVLARNGQHGDIDLTPAIEVFHRWIQTDALPELLVDVADYRHVPEGPGVVLVAHEAIYGLDERDGRLGLLYDRRTAVDGDPADAVRISLSGALRGCSKLTQEPELSAVLDFDAGACEVLVNDRALADNDDPTATKLESVLRSVFDQVWNGSGYQLERLGEGRDRLGFSARANEPQELAAVLQRAGG